MSPRRSLGRFSGTAPAACIGTALLLVLLVGGWGAYHDLTALQESVIQGEMTRIRSHAERSVGRIEAQLLEEGFGTDLASALKARWLRNHWKQTVHNVPDRMYGAIVDLGGTVLSHSDPDQEQKTLSAAWSGTPLKKYGPGVVETSTPELSGGVRTIDVSVPILFQNQPVGVFHSGVDANWLDQRVAIARKPAMNGWFVVIGGILGVVLLSSVSLYRITRHTARLEAALDLSDARRLSEVSQLIVGVAHEVRNPLNAVRLNLYTAERVFRGETQLERDEIQVMLSESVREIERVDELIQQLLGYARVESHQPETIEFAQEVRNALQFLKHSLDQAQVRVNFDAPGGRIMVQMDRGRLRQILLNLIKNACEAAGSGGGIFVRIERVGEHAELTVRDTGPGVPAELRDRIFDPFFTTKDSGTGMGLAVVRSLVEVAGGTIHCDAETKGGGCFRVMLPCAATFYREVA